MKRASPEDDLATTVAGSHEHLYHPDEDKAENDDDEGPTLHQPLPPHNPSPDKADAWLAQAMNKLSIVERSRIIEEIHGIPNNIDENPVFVHQRLQMLEMEIAKIRHKDAYDEALARSTTFAQDDRFRLKFLRARDFDPKAAASMLVGFFQMKRKLFGSDLLTKRVELKDLSSDDLACLRNGAAQLLPVRDRAGRAVFCFMLPHIQYKSVENTIRVVWHLLMSAMEDEETQKNGMVLIAYNVGLRVEAFSDRSLAWKLPVVVRFLPINMKSIHICSDNPKAKLLRGLLILRLTEKAKQRLRFYNGSHVECRYELLSFGIPVDYLPVTENGDLKLANHNKWISRRKAKEKAVRDGVNLDGVIDLPTNRDVMIARGKPFRFHRGSDLLYNLIDDKLGEYDNRKRGDKRDVIKEIVQLVKDAGGRFLRKDDTGWWLQASDSDAIQKVISTLRSRRTKDSTETRAAGSMALPAENGKKARIVFNQP